MTTYDALYATVLERPFDDAPRLVLADWLEENGQAATAARLRRAVAAPRYVVRRCKVTGFPGLTFHEARGFPFRVVGTIQAFMPEAARLFRTWPVTDVALDYARPYRNHDEAEGRRAKGVPDHWYLWERYHRDDAQGTIGADDVPRPIFRFLGGTLTQRDWYRAFPTKKAAALALRRACVRFGRDAAGLPDIKWPEEAKT